MKVVGHEDLHTTLDNVTELCGYVALYSKFESTGKDP